jgi:dTDP-4-dehydrorhamnose 3,5-epimerase
MVNDDRGSFSKVLGEPHTSAIDFKLAEIFWTRSESGVLRGMHLQLPPNDGRKIVWVSEGAVLDVVVDLRSDSSTYLCWSRVNLTPGSGSLVVPAGCAHGFEVIGAPAVVNYVQECRFDPACDTGIRWDSFGMTWLLADPVVSLRDRSLPVLSAFIGTLRSAE